MKFSHRLTRRAAVAGLAFAPAVARAQDVSTEVLEPDNDTLLSAELFRADFADDGLGAMFADEARRRVAADRYWAMAEAERPAPAWAVKSKAIDYHHLAEFSEPASSTFTLDGAALEWLASRNSFDLTSNENLIFGLRGCVIAGVVSEEADWRASHRLQWTMPDHLQMKCVLGVWRRDQNLIRVFTGSTVPEANSIWQARNRVGMCNLQPTGLYEFVAGSHNGGSTSYPQHGALRQPEDQPIAVLRSPNNLIFDSTEATEVWDFGVFNNNLHSACRISQRTPRFFSAGCQIVAGGYELRQPLGRAPVGQWYEFRTSVGLGKCLPQHENPDTGRRFKYMLLTGLEAALYAHDIAFRERYKRLRFGSTTLGQGAVQRLQSSLNVQVTGRVDVSTIRAHLRRLNAEGTFESGVIAEAVRS